jgi:hypothetical protein
VSKAVVASIIDCTAKALKASKKMKQKTNKNIFYRVSDKKDMFLYSLFPVLRISSIGVVVVFEFFYFHSARRHNISPRTTLLSFFLALI